MLIIASMSILTLAYLLVLASLKFFTAVESISHSQFFSDHDITSVSKQDKFKLGVARREGNPISHNDMYDMYISTHMRKYLQVDNLQPSPSPGLSPSSVSHLCDTHGLCGVYGVCNASKSPVCECLQGFRPNSQQEWDSMNWTRGCVRDKALNCNAKDGDSFILLLDVKLPDGTQSFIDQSIGLQECRQNCINNCSCTAYTIVTHNVTGGDANFFPYGCAMWFVDLINIKQLSTGGQNLFVRIAASELGNNQGKGNKKIAAVVSVTVSVTAIAVALVGCHYFKRRKLKRGVQKTNVKEQNSDMEDLDLPLFNLMTITTATNNFAMNNKLGEGGFGPVYWGKLEDGKEIAVKRLSQSSGQGLTEFKNEVKLIAKVQHRNLVRLLGCCIQEEETMLVYEYLPNKGLDSFLFDETKRKLLDWSTRFRIICGIARGLLYLHEESRLRIIHRDLKASNVLLDYQFNPKISDFGMARTFGGDQTEGNTRRIVGTFGYMAPEYAIDGLFSVKSDVFSFGILLLEIISGKKNKGFYNPNHFQNLITHAWKLRKEGRALEMIDPILQEESRNLGDILRVIHISLLCLQRHPEERPSMSSIVLMLGSDVEMSEPKRPGFLMGRNPSEAESSSSKQKTSSTNDITISLIEAR